MQGWGAGASPRGQNARDDPGTDIRNQDTFGHHSVPRHIRDSEPRRQARAREFVSHRTRTSRSESSLSLDADDFGLSFSRHCQISEGGTPVLLMSQLPEEQFWPPWLHDHPVPSSFSSVLGHSSRTHSLGILPPCQPACRDPAQTASPPPPPPRARLHGKHTLGL